MVERKSSGRSADGGRRRMGKRERERGEGGSKV